MPELPTAFVTASSAATHISLLNTMAVNLNSSTAFLGSSASQLNGLGANLVNSSGTMNASSAVAYNNILTSFTNWLNNVMFTSSSAAGYVRQILGASSAMTSMMLQGQSGYKVSG